MPLTLPELLGRLEETWRAQRAPIARHLAAGLDSDAVKSRLRQLGLTPDTEVLQWYAWHDGIEGSNEPEAAYMGPYDLMILSLQEACEHLRARQSLARQIGTTEPTGLYTSWNFDWFPLCLQGDGTVLVKDLGTGPDRGSIRLFRTEDIAYEPAHIAAQSLAAFVSQWLDQLEAREVRWSTESWSWKYQS